MTKVRRTSGAAVLPLVAAAVGLGVGATPADAAICSPLSSASITGPSGTITAGSTVHASARVSGMLLTARMQITGPGLDQQVGPSVIGGTIEGDVRVPEPGVFTLRVVGNGTGCVYDSDSFSVKERPSVSKPSPRGAGAPSTPGATRASRLPRGIRDGGTTGLTAPSRTPFRLPSVTPDGTGPSVHYPSADPQVAAPPVKQPQPRASNVAQTLPPIKWGQSIAIALVLLLLSAHMGMWSRRQRLAEARTRRGRGAGGGRGTRGARRTSANHQVTARMPLASDHPAVPRNGDRPAVPQVGGRPVAARDDGPPVVPRGGDRPVTAQDGGGPVAVSVSGQPASRMTGQSPLNGSTRESGAVDWESWVGTRRRMGAEDRANTRGWVDAADGDGSRNRDAQVYASGEIAGRSLPYPLDHPARAGRAGDALRDGQTNAAGWAAVPPASAVGGRESGAESGREGSAGRGGSAVSVGRATRSGRGGYRGRRRRS